MNRLTHLTPEQIQQARSVNLVALAALFGAKLTPDGTEFIGACPICGGRDRFSIGPGKAGLRVFHCRGCARGGRGAIDLWFFLTGKDRKLYFAEAVRELTGDAVMSGELRQHAKTDNLSTFDDHEARQHAKASRLWHYMASPPAGTLVEKYLRVRGYRGPIPPTIRFLNSDRYGPTMIAAFGVPCSSSPQLEDSKLTPPHGVTSVHLTSLRPDGSDRLRHKGAKRAVGRHIGLPVVLASIGADGTLHIAEGVEAALLYAHEGGAWSACGANFMAALAPVIPACVTRLVIEQDDDEAGETNTKRLSEAIRELERTGVRAGHPIDIEIVRERAP